LVERLKTKTLVQTLVFSNRLNTFFLFFVARTKSIYVSFTDLLVLLTPHYKVWRWWWLNTKIVAK